MERTGDLNGMMVRTGELYGRVKVCDAETGQEIRTLDSVGASCGALSNDGSRFITGHTKTKQKLSGQ